MALSLAGPPLTSLLGLQTYYHGERKACFLLCKELWPEEGVGTLHILLENISIVLQNICHPTQRILQILTIEPWKGEHRQASWEDFLSPGFSISHSGELRALSSRPRSGLLQLCIWFCCALLTLLNANLNERLDVTSPPLQDSSGLGVGGGARDSDLGTVPTLLVRCCQVSVNLPEVSPVPSCWRPLSGLCQGGCHSGLMCTPDPFLN